MRNIKSQLVAARDANDATFFFLNCGVDLVNDLLGLARAGAANNEFYHSLYPPNL